jgi:3-methyladenine DNA glycosylase AlkD
MPRPTVSSILTALRRKGSQRNRDGMARYAIVAPKVFGVSVATIRGMARGIGRDHDLALALWKSGWYEARMLAAFVDDPALVTPAQMNRWVKDFDN